MYVCRYEFLPRSQKFDKNVGLHRLYTSGSSREELPKICARFSLANVEATLDRIVHSSTRYG